MYRGYVRLIPVLANFYEQSSDWKTLDSTNLVELFNIINTNSVFTIKKADLDEDLQKNSYRESDQLKIFS